MEQDERVSIWTVTRQDQRVYSWLFPVTWGSGLAVYVLAGPPPTVEGWLSTLERTILGIGTVGISAAVLSMILLAAWRFTLALFDWPKKIDRVREQALTEGDARGFARALDVLRTVQKEYPDNSLDDAVQRLEELEEDASQQQTQRGA